MSGSSAFANTFNSIASALDARKRRKLEDEMAKWRQASYAEERDYGRARDVEERDYNRAQDVQTRDDRLNERDYRRGRDAAEWGREQRRWDEGAEGRRLEQEARAEAVKRMRSQRRERERTATRDWLLGDLKANRELMQFGQQVMESLGIGGRKPATAEYERDMEDGMRVKWRGPLRKDAVAMPDPMGDAAAATDAAVLAKLNSMIEEDSGQLAEGDKRAGFLQFLGGGTDRQRRLDENLARRRELMGGGGETARASGGGSRGNTELVSPDELEEAVKNGQLSVADAKWIAEKKGWK